MPDADFLCIMFSFSSGHKNVSDEALPCRVCSPRQPSVATPLPEGGIRASLTEGGGA